MKENNIFEFIFIYFNVLEIVESRDILLCDKDLEMKFMDSIKLVSR